MDHHLECFGNGDLEGILSDYAEDAVLFTSDGVLEGIAAIRPLFVAMLEEFGLPGVEFQLLAAHAEGECAFIAWKAETPRNSYAMGADTLFVRDGKIVAQTFAAHVTPKS